MMLNPRPSQLAMNLVSSRPSPIRLLNRCSVLLLAALPSTTLAAAPAPFWPQFTDVTEPAGIHFQHHLGDLELSNIAEATGPGGLFFDFDNDGFQDLYLVNGRWHPDISDNRGRSFRGKLRNALYRNNGDGTFTDVSNASGIRAVVGKGMGLGIADFDGDGWPDVFVANDTEPNYLFRNLGNGKFEEIGFVAGVAYPEAGRALSGMGADAADIDDDGRPDIFHTALSSETMPVFRNQGKNTFLEVTARAGVSSLSLSRAGWSCGIVDLNNDGRKDLFVAGGDVMDPVGEFREKVRQTNLVLANLGGFKFVDATPGAGPDFSTKRAPHRGGAFGDLDDDGRVDAVVTALDEPVEVWRNVSPVSNRWLAVRTVGTRSNRDGMGAEITLTTTSGVRHGLVNTAVGYGGASDPRVHFGLGKDETVTKLEVRWPSGTVQVLENVASNQVLVVREPEK